MIIMLLLSVANHAVDVQPYPQLSGGIALWAEVDLIPAVI